MDRAEAVRARLETIRAINEQRKQEKVYLEAVAKEEAKRLERERDEAHKAEVEAALALAAERFAKKEAAKKAAKEEEKRKAEARVAAFEAKKQAEIDEQNARLREAATLHKSLPPRPEVVPAHGKTAHLAKRKSALKKESEQKSA